MFDSVDPKQRLTDLEEGILQYWKEEDTFKRSLRQRQFHHEGDLLENGRRPDPSATKDTRFSFYDGPPFATGLPHYGHILAGTIKDVIPRYQTMRGKYVERRFGWDCHGLPIENLIEQENGIENKRQIEEMGVGKFNELCRASVQRYTKEWRTVVERMGRWVDMDWDYRTMDPPYMESMWWGFQQLHKKGLVYEGYKPMHVCPRCVTPLSNFEVTQGYTDISDQSVTVRFLLKEAEETKESEEKTYILAWTTTPWTLPGNLFLAVGKTIQYVEVACEGARYILAENLVEKVFKGREFEIKTAVTMADLIGRQYVPLFPYFAEEYRDRAFRVVEGDFVTTDDGTGVVHIATGFGEDDFSVGKREFGKDYIPLQHVTMEGKFVDAVTDFVGMDVKPKDDPSKTDKKIAQWLEQKGTLFSKEMYKHSYPHCWRCDSPLLNYATSSWFVKVESIKEKMLRNNAKTEWVPAHIRDGRYGKWLEGARDWAISRSRYWGTPLPIWRDDAGTIDVVGGRDELMAKKQLRFTKITVLRHAESEGNLIPIYQGDPPGTPLTERGRNQAKNTAALYRNQTVDIIYCSPLLRARQTADIVATELGARVIVDDRLRELRFGEYEGKTVDFTNLSFLKERRALKIQKDRPESIYHLEGMEEWETVRARMESFMEDVLPKHRSEHVMVITHADPALNMRGFFTGESLMKLSQQPYPDYAAPNTYFWDHDREAELDLHKDAVDPIIWQGQESDRSVQLTLARHGQTDWNKEMKVQGGEVDEPLNDHGRTQARELAAALKKRKHAFDAIISSDLKRATETAKILAEELGVPHEGMWTELRERMMGATSGRNVQEYMDQYSTHIPEINPAMSYVSHEGGETLSEFLRRMESAAEKIRGAYAGKRVLVVCHSGVVQGMRGIAENLNYREVVAAKARNAEAVDILLHPCFRRIPEVLDCWFESGSMPYAQQNYPYAMHTGHAHASAAHGLLPPSFPADFIAEGLDQTRAWFYTLMVLSTALFDDTPFLNVIVNGIVLAEDGKKMSKRLRNYPDPLEVVGRHGADAVRFTLMSSPAVRAEDLRFSEKLVEETVRSVLLPLWNTYAFFVTYANAAGFKPVESRRHSSHPLDRWIRAEAQDLVNRMTEQLDCYDLSATCAELHDTIDALTNWYVRLSRRRFAGKGATDQEMASGDREKEEQQEAISTLYDVLLTVSQLLAPFCPYITDAMYLNLVEDDHGSIHLTDWPQTRELSPQERMLLEKTRLMRLIVSLGLSVRGETKVKTRQPLAKATVAVPPALARSIAFSDEDLSLLRQELNVKELAFAEDPRELAEAYVQVDARKVGPRLGARVQEIIRAGKSGEFTQNEDGTILILDETLTPAEATLVFRGKDGENVAAGNGVVVCLDTAVNETLQREGDARDLIRGVQRLRKDAGLAFTDRIALAISGADDVLKEFGQLIAEETRSILRKNAGDTHEIELSSGIATIQFEKSEP